MAQYREEMKNTFRTFASIARPMDPNRVELIFASQPHKVLKLNNGLQYTLAGTPHRVEEAFDNCRFDQRTGLMENKLNAVATSITKNVEASCSTSLFVFTDGRWCTDSHCSCGLENVIQRLMKATKLHNDRTRVMVQFIRFGDDLEGIRHLNHLDQFGKQDGW